MDHSLEPPTVPQAHCGEVNILVVSGSNVHQYSGFIQIV